MKTESKLLAVLEIADLIKDGKPLPENAHETIRDFACAPCEKSLSAARGAIAFGYFGEPGPEPGEAEWQEDFHNAGAKHRADVEALAKLIIHARVFRLIPLEIAHPALDALRLDGSKVAVDAWNLIFTHAEGHNGNPTLAIEAES